MKCSYCGRGLDETAKFCTYCGSRIQGDQERNEAEVALPAIPLEQDCQESMPDLPEQIASTNLLSFRTVNCGSRYSMPQRDGRQRDAASCNHG